MKQFRFKFIWICNPKVKAPKHRWLPAVEASFQTTYRLFTWSKRKWLFRRASFYPTNQNNLKRFQKALIDWKKADPLKKPLLLWSCKQAKCAYFFFSNSAVFVAGTLTMLFALRPEYPFYAIARNKRRWRYIFWTNPHKLRSFPFPSFPFDSLAFSQLISGCLFEPKSIAKMSQMKLSRFFACGHSTVKCKWAIIGLQLLHYYHYY